MDAIQMFKEAAKEMQNDERYKKLDAARRANDEDTDLQNEIGEFNLVRLDLNNEMEKGEKDEKKLGELNTRINELYNNVMTNPNMLAYNEAQQEMKGLISYINAIISAAVDGDDPLLVQEPVAGGCGEEGCSSCSGCG